MILIIFLAFFFSFGSLYAIKQYLQGNKLTSGDTFYHLWISKLLRKNKFKYPSDIPNLKFIDAEKSNYLVYPPILHYITSLFPTKLHPQIAKIFNLGVVSILCVFAASISYTVTSNLLATLLSALFVFFNIAAIEISTGFNPRPLGCLWFTCFFYTVLFFPLSIVSFLFASLFVMLLVLTHKFALQVLTLVLIPYALIFGQPLLIATYFTGIFFALVISRGFYIKILREHIKWLVHYARLTDSADYSIRSYLSHLKGIIARNPAYFVILLSVIPLFTQANSIQYTDLTLQLLFLALAPLVISLLVALPHFAFIGEDYRYIEYALVPVASIISIFTVITQFNLIILIGCLVSISASLFGLSLYKKYLKNSKFLVESDDISKTFPALKKMVEGRIMVLPMYRTMEVSYFSELNTVHLVRVDANHADIVNFMKRFDVHYILKFKDFADVRSNDLYQYLIQNTVIEKKFEFNNAELYKIISS